MKRSSLLLILIFFTGWGSASAQSAGAPAGTYLGGMYSSFSGERENSLAGSEGFGVMLLTTPHKSHFRLVYGAILSFEDGIGYVQSARHNTTMYSADAFIGFSIYPILTNVAIRPFLEAGGLGGFKHMEVISPPADVDGRSTGLSYGYRLAIGLETQITTKFGARISADYIKNTADIAGTSSFQLDNFAFNLGFLF